MLRGTEKPKSWEPLALGYMISDQNKQVITLIQGAFALLTVIMQKLSKEN
jgi:hypothetical protein